MSRRASRIAIVDDDAELRPVLAGILKTAGFETQLFSSGDEFLQSGGPRFFSLVVTDLQMSGATGLDVLQACRAVDEPAEVLLITGFASIPNAVEAMRLGAIDYLAKPVDPVELIHRVQKAVDTRALRHEIVALSEEVRRRDGGGPIASSRAMRELLARAREVAVSSAAVLITGETGVGKKMVAREIQAGSRRADRPYLTIDCAAFPESLLEVELFGASGSGRRRGLFEQASGGTLLLGEIASLGLRGQGRLLRVLKESAVHRIGEDEAVSVDIRVLCTTSGNLPDRLERGDFREELVHHLSLSLVVPPLRERPEDVEPLARQFLADAARRLGKLRAFSPDALEALRDCEFPGNVRELRFVIEQAAERSADGLLRARDFESLPRARRSSPAPRRLGRSRPIAEEVTVERLREALRQNGGNRVRAARALGISRASLYRLLSAEGKTPGGKSGE